MLCIGITRGITCLDPLLPVRRTSAVYAPLWFSLVLILRDYVLTGAAVLLTVGCIRGCALYLHVLAIPAVAHARRNHSDVPLGGPNGSHVGTLVVTRDATAIVGVEQVCAWAFFHGGGATNGLCV